MEIKKAPARQADWRLQLAQYLAQVVRLKFQPGAHDCALFAAGAVQAMTGTDLAADWRGSYRSLAAGRRALEVAGFDSHVDLAASIFSEIAPAFAQAGDLAVMPGDAGSDALGIIQGAHVYVLTPSGMALVNRLHIKRAFRI